MVVMARQWITSPRWIDKLKSLQKKLEKAIANEDFVAAATLRDEVKALRAQMTELSTAK